MKKCKNNVGAVAPKSAQTSKDKQNSGITLIALVITIIVMLILVAVTITMAVNGGLFNYAGRATTQTNNAIVAEQQLASGGVSVGDRNYNSIDEYLDSMDDIVGVDGEIFSPILKEKTTITQGEYTAVIPEGFSVGKSDGINTIEDGLVIQDAKGNQFVWIPVTYTATGTLDSNGLDSGFLATFKRSTTSTSYTEPYARGYSDGSGTEEAADYYDMMLSVQKNKGFYIGRFEAGIEQTGAPRTQYTDSNQTTYKANGESTMVVKRDCYPYNFVGWGKDMSDYTTTIKYDYDNYSYSETGLDQGRGALYLSKHLLDGQTIGATSTLCYGVQWDAMLKFMGKDTETDSTEWGNYINNEFTIDRPTARWTSNPDSDATWTPIGATAQEKSKSEGILLTTGASDEFEAKNIYDVAGNVVEWTMEAADTDWRFTRGSSCYGYGDYRPSSSREHADPYFCMDFIGFRPSLFVS